VFRGALDCRAATIMTMEAAGDGAGKTSDLNREHIIPSVFDERVAAASAVQRAARQVLLS